MHLEAAVCNCSSKISKNSLMIEFIFKTIAGLQRERKPENIFLVEGFISILNVKTQLVLLRYL